MSTEEFNFSVNLSFGEDIGYNTLVTQYEDGKEQRRKKWSQPKRRYSISLRGRTDTEMQQVWDFYNSRSGAYETFYFKNPNDNPVNDEVLGTGNGSNLNFQLVNYPLPSGSITLTVDGTPKTETTHYTLTRSTGAIIFNSPDVPLSGDEVSATYDFCRVVRFTDDKLSRELFNFKLYNADLGLIQVL